MQTFISVVLACGVIGWFVYPFFTIGKKSASVTSGQAVVDNGPQEYEGLLGRSIVHHYPAFNVDGTPMVGMLDINGNIRGSTSSFDD